MVLSAKVPRIVSGVTAGGHFPSWQGLTDTTESEPGPPNSHTHTTQAHTRKLHVLPSLSPNCFTNHNIT